MKLVHDENRGDMIYWDFNIQDCLQDLFSVKPCYFSRNDFIFQINNGKFEGGCYYLFYFDFLFAYSLI